MYGIQTVKREIGNLSEFENDVKMYGIQTCKLSFAWHFIVWEWCKNVWYSNGETQYLVTALFENDVKMYGIQTVALYDETETVFENDVKMYGIQTSLCAL